MKQNLFAVALLVIDIVIGYLARGRMGESTRHQPDAGSWRPDKLSILRYEGKYFVSADYMTRKGTQTILEAGQDAQFSFGVNGGIGGSMKLHAPANGDKDPFTIIWE